MSNPVVNIKGKNYRMVSDRVKQFRTIEKYSGHRIQTEMIFFDGKDLILKSSILDSDGNILSDGIASEKAFKPLAKAKTKGANASPNLSCKSPKALDACFN